MGKSVLPKTSGPKAKKGKTEPLYVSPLLDSSVTHADLSDLKSQLGKKLVAIAFV